MAIEYQFLKLLNLSVSEGISLDMVTRGAFRFPSAFVTLVEGVVVCKLLPMPGVNELARYTRIANL